MVYTNSAEADPTPGFERSPFELGLGWLVKLDGGDFVGKDALLAQQQSGREFTLRSFEIQDTRKPADGAVLFTNIDGQERSVGSINCSGWSWDLGEFIGNASIELPFDDSTEVWTKLENEPVRVRLSRGPLRRFERYRQVPAPVKP